MALCKGDLEPLMQMNLTRSEDEGDSAIDISVVRWHNCNRDLVPDRDFVCNGGVRDVCFSLWQSATLQMTLTFPRTKDGNHRGRAGRWQEMRAE